MTRLALSRYLRYLSQTRGGTGSGSASASSSSRSISASAGAAAAAAALFRAAALAARDGAGRPRRGSRRRISGPNRPRRRTRRPGPKAPFATPPPRGAPHADGDVGLVRQQRRRPPAAARRRREVLGRALRLAFCFSRRRGRRVQLWRRRTSTTYFAFDTSWPRVAAGCPVLGAETARAAALSAPGCPGRGEPCHERCLSGGVRAHRAGMLLAGEGAQRHKELGSPAPAAPELAVTPSGRSAVLSRLRPTAARANAASAPGKRATMGKKDK